MNFTELNRNWYFRIHYYKGENTSGKAKYHKRKSVSALQLFRIIGNDRMQKYLIKANNQDKPFYATINRTVRVCVYRSRNALQGF